MSEKINILFIVYLIYLQLQLDVFIHGYNSICIFFSIFPNTPSFRFWTSLSGIKQNTATSLLDD